MEDVPLTAKEIAAEKQRVRMRRWRQANRDHIKRYQKEWLAKKADHVRAYAKAYNATYRAMPEKQWEYWVRNLRRNYRMTPEEFNKLWEKQAGRCAICDCEMKPRGKVRDAVSVDHNHETMEVRGLLCRSCNIGLGNLRDSPEVLRKAADYLEQRGTYSVKH